MVLAWGYSNSTGWTISTFTNNIQTFEVLNPGTYDLQIIKWYTRPGSESFLIKYFENGTAETRRKVVVWQ